MRGRDGAVGRVPEDGRGHLRGGGFSLGPSCPQEGVPWPWLRAGLFRAPTVRTPHSGGGGLVASEQGPRDTQRGACERAPGEIP